MDNYLETLQAGFSNPQLFEFLVKNTSAGLFTCDNAGYLTFFNKAAVALWGREPVVGTDLWSGAWKTFYDDGKPMAPENIPMAKALTEGKAYKDECIIIERPDHTYRTLLVSPEPVFDKHNKLIGAFSTLVDITEKNAALPNQAFLSAIVESSDDAIISKNLNGIITSWNAGAERIFGYKDSEVIGKPILIIIPPDRINEEEVILSNIRKGQKIDHFETIRVQKSGKEIPISITVSPIRDPEGKIIGASKIARDISERLHAEKQINEHAHHQETLNAIAKAISEKLDTQSILQKVTEATTKLTGAAFGAFFYNTVDERGESYTLFTLSGAPREAFEKFGMPRNTAVFHPTFSGQGVVRSEDITKDERYGQNAPHFGMPKGHLPVRSYLAVPVVSRSGHVIGGLFFGHPEVGVFKSSHEDLIVNIASQAAVALDNSRLFEEIKTLSAKKDEFIALASHELKTPITTIKGYLQILSNGEVSDASAFIERCLKQVDRLSSLVEELLDVSRIEAGKLQLRKQPFDFRELVVELIENFSFTNKSHSIIFDDPQVELLVEADRYRIEQVLINLLTNAMKYSPQADKVYLSVRHNENFLTTIIRDEGIGLTDFQKSRLFNRFYRAEDVTHIPGLGLGLYLTKEILVRHGGKIDVISEPGKGSEFYFTLPLR